MKYLIISLVLFGLLGFSSTARAQLFLEQGKLVLPVTPGTRLSNTLTVHNTSNRAVTVNAYWEDFEYQPPFNGPKSFLPARSSPMSAATWVTFSPQDFTLAPFALKKIDYIINVPSKVSGGHYGVLFFETAPETPDSTRGLSIATRVGCLFFLEPTDKNKNARVDHVLAEGENLTGDFVNEGNVILIPDGSFYVQDASGVAVDRGVIPKMYVPPGQTAHFTVPVSADLPAGSYTIVLNIDLQDGDVLVKEIDIDKGGELIIRQIRD